MADSPKPSPKGFMAEFGWFIWGLIGLAALWFFTGGPNREISHQGVYLKPPAPIDSGQAYGKYYAGTPSTKKQELNLPDDPSLLIKRTETILDEFLKQSTEAQKIHNTSLLSKTIFLDGIAGAKNDLASKEYIRIVANDLAKDSIKISGLSLKGYSLGVVSVIPKATELHLSGINTPKTDVFLPPGGRAIISSGRSPIGTSFRVNMCTGYLDQFQDYTPALFNDCPYPKDEILRFGPKDEASCVDFVEKLSRCKTYFGDLPQNISTSCKNFIGNRLNYNSCVANHKNDENFYSNEWRIFLDKQTELWGNKNEVIRLIDAKGNIVDAITY